MQKAERGGMMLEGMIFASLGMAFDGGAVVDADARKMKIRAVNVKRTTLGTTKALEW